MLPASCNKFRLEIKYGGGFPPLRFAQLYRITAVRFMALGPSSLDFPKCSQINASVHRLSAEPYNTGFHCGTANQLRNIFHHLFIAIQTSSSILFLNFCWTCQLAAFPRTLNCRPLPHDFETLSQRLLSRVFELLSLNLPPDGPALRTLMFDLESFAHGRLFYRDRRSQESIAFVTHAASQTLPHLPNTLKQVKLSNWRPTLSREQEKRVHNTACVIVNCNNSPH